MFCNNCGKEVKDGSKFCNKCGAAVDAETPVGAVVNRPNNRPRWRVITALSILLPVVAVLVFGVVYFFNRPANDTEIADEQTAAIGDEAGDENAEDKDDENNEAEGAETDTTDKDTDSDAGRIVAYTGYTELVPFIYDDIRLEDDGFVVSVGAGANEKWGLLDMNGAEVVPPSYPYYDVPSFSDGPMVKYNEDWQPRVVDGSGNTIVPSGTYDGIGGYSEGLAVVRVGDGNGVYEYGGGKYGMIDSTGREIIAPKYDYIDLFSEGMASVLLDGKWGFIDRDGNEAISLRYDRVDSKYYQDSWVEISGEIFSEGLAAVGAGDAYNSEWNYWESYKWGFVDATGYEVVSPKYNAVRSFSDGRAAVMVGDWETGKWGFIDKNGNEAVPPIYDEVHSFSDGLAAVMVGDWETGKWGFIDMNGNEVVPPIYDDVGASIYYGRNNFSEGLSAVGMGKAAWAMTESFDGEEAGDYIGKWGFIDTQGKEVISLEYEYVWDYSNGFARVNRGGRIMGSDSGYSPSGGKWGFVDKDGHEVVPCEYDVVCDFSPGGLAIAGIGNVRGEWGDWESYKCGVIDMIGRVIVPLEYDFLYHELYEWSIYNRVYNGLFLAKRGDKWGVLQLY